jgi:DNA-binding NarL/FixJ family response regulator
MIFLIADDNARMRESLKRFLSRNVPDHHQFIEAVDGDNALRLFEQYRPDVVLMDIQMEPMDGLTALRLIRTVDTEARIVIVTSFDDVRYRAAAHEAGAAGYVMKDHLDDMLAFLPGVRRP